MNISDIISDDSHSEFVQKTHQSFITTGLKFVNPYFANVKQLHTGEVGRHTGLYFIFQKTPEGYIYYYTGIATKGNTVHKRFQPHYAKLTVNLPAMYGKLDRSSRETQWQFPKNWRKGVKQHFLNNPDDIPDYWVGKQKRDILQPANLDWKPEFKISVDALPVMVFDLPHGTPQQIDTLETEFIKVFKPVFNGAKVKKI